MPRIGLVLGGGGFTGTAFHAGVITALAREGQWDARGAEVIVGTSAGSTSAALLRAGFPPLDYVGRVCGHPVSDEARVVLAGIGRVPDPPRRPPWRLRPASPDLLRRIVRKPLGYPIGTAIAAALPEGTVPVTAVSPGFGPLFETWPTREMWIGAVNLETGRRAAFGRDATASVAEAVAASCAIPGYFQPVTIDGDRYVDGGAHSLHSLDLVAGLGLDLVIVSAPLATTDWLAPDPGNLPRIAARRQLEREASVVRRAGTPVLIIAPEAGLRRLMGTNSMVLAKRARVALATQTHVTRLLRQGRILI
ncbi:MAG: patatin-like phospholipase family protein [Candidatus Nanopelagicales bacterium]|nr:patatin-like phospholipase family protein [Candidatus Nanopelagicales bacterium]